MSFFKQHILINNSIKKNLFLLFVIIFSLAQKSLEAQIYTVGVKMDTSKILIGDQTKLTISVRIPSETIGSKNHFLKWHTIKDTISQNIEVISVSKIDTSISKDKKTYLLTQNIIITSFDSGFFVIPPFRFLRNGDSLKYMETQALLLEVVTLAVDTTQAIKDIKPPLEIPFTFSELLPYVIIGILVVLVILVIIYLFLKRKNKALVNPEKEIIIPDHEIALAKLNELKAKRLCQEGKSKEYYTQLTEIIRNYIEGRFKIMALEKTTEEIITSFRSLDINEDSKNKLKQILSLADFVKFAKINPLPLENELCINNAFDFVTQTIPKLEIIEIEKMEVNND